MSRLNNSKLIAGIIKKLSSQDFGKIPRFLESPYHNTNSALCPFFKAIKSNWKNYPKFDNKNFTEERVYKKIYPGKTFNTGTFEGLKTDLVKKIEAYLAYEEVSRNEQLKKDLMIQGYAHRSDYNTFRDKSRTAIEALEEKKPKTLEEFQQLLDKNHKLFFHPGTPRDNAFADSYIRSCMESLDCFYFLSKMIYATEFLTREGLKDQRYEIRLLDETIKLGKQTELSDSILFQTYSLMCTFMKSQNDENFKKLKEYLFLYKDKISNIGKLGSSIILTNYAFAQYQNEKNSFQKEIFLLYKFRDEQNVMLTNDSIPDNTFIGAISTATACGELEWATHFLKKYASKIKEDRQEDALCFSQAYIHFYEKAYLKTVKMLTDVEHRTLYTNLRFRSLTIRAFYELSMTDNKSDDGEDFEDKVERSVRSFNHYLSGREDMKKDKKDAYKNFCLICLDLICYRKDRVLKKLAEKGSLMFRPWIEEKVKALRWH